MGGRVRLTPSEQLGFAQHRLIARSKNPAEGQVWAGLRPGSHPPAGGGWVSEMEHSWFNVAYHVRLRGGSIIA